MRPRNWRAAESSPSDSAFRGTWRRQDNHNKAGIVSGLGAAAEEEVTSPTFALVHKYGDGAHVYHADLYRVTDLHDLDTLGLVDIFSEQAVVIVEWPEKLSPPSDWPVMRIRLEHVAEDTRRISITEADDGKP